MATQLSVYNLALGHLEQRALGSLSEAVEHRRVLDTYWQHAVGYCQEQGLWTFMVRSVKQDESSTVVPAFGWIYAFRLPADWVRMVILSTAPMFDPPLTQYREEAGYLFANFTPLYMAYVSNDAEYGWNVGAWPAVFTELVSLALARMACKRITGSSELLRGPEGLIEREKRARIDARSKDAMNLPPGFMPQSSWVRARRGFMTMMPMSGDDGPLPAGGF